MDMNKLAEDRIKLIRKAVRKQENVERIPHLSHFATWKILDCGYKLSEAMSNWDLMSNIQVDFQKKYNFDMFIEWGNRNNFLVSKAMGSSQYVIDDNLGAVNYVEVPYCQQQELKEFAENIDKFKWEVALPRKYPFLSNSFNISILQNAIDENIKFQKYTPAVLKRLHDECGLPAFVSPKAGAPIPIEALMFNIRGIRGLSIDMHRNKDLINDVINALNERYFKPGLNRMKSFPAGEGDSSCFDMTLTTLAPSMLSRKQFEKYYWPYLKQVLDVVSEKGWITRLFTEGSSKMFWDYLSEIPKGCVAVHLENDDIFEAQKMLSNLAFIGGMKNEMLNGGTKTQCLDFSKNLIDEFGLNGGLLFSTDKLGSYANDANSENLKAVCDFVSEYVPSHN